MKNIYESASKIVLIMFALTICVGLFVGVVSEELFKLSALMVLTYYFSIQSPGGGKKPPAVEA